MEIGAIIKKLREEHDMSQEDLAKALDVTFQAVSTWETGKRQPRMGIIEKMVVLFGVSKSYLIGEQEPPVYEGMNLSDAERQLILALRAASPETREIIHRIIER